MLAFSNVVITLRRDDVADVQRRVRNRLTGKHVITAERDDCNRRPLKGIESERPLHRGLGKGRLQTGVGALLELFSRFGWRGLRCCCAI